MTRYFLRPDADGDLWDPDWPVMMVDWFSARAFARWEAERTGLPWRLPSELEWEKAARGVDQRAYPWGRQYDPSWTCMLDSHAQAPLPRPVGTTEGDISPYGVREMAGNIQDWCSEPWMPDGPPIDASGRAVRPAPNEQETPAGRRSVRGACWYFGDQYGRSAERFSLPASYLSDCLGIRLVRDA